LNEAGRIGEHMAQFACSAFSSLIKPRRPHLYLTLSCGSRSTSWAKAIFINLTKREITKPLADRPSPYRFDRSLIRPPNRRVLQTGQNHQSRQLPLRRASGPVVRRANTIIFVPFLRPRESSSILRSNSWSAAGAILRFRICASAISFFRHL
jgi:hypothetical protein